MKIRIDSKKNPIKTLELRVLFAQTLLLVFLAANQAGAQTPTKKKLPPPKTPPPVKVESTKVEEEWSLEKSFIESNIAISNWFDGVAEGLDLFLVGKKVTNRPNQTNVKIINHTVSTEGEDVVSGFGVSLNPRLPNLEEYWHLKFATYDEQEDKRNAKSTYLGQTPLKKNYGATVGVFRKLGSVRTAFQPRIELQDPLRVAHSITFESVAAMPTYEFNPKIEFYANPVTGVGTMQALNFNFQLSKVFSLTLVNQGDYSEKLRMYSVTNGFSIGQALTPNSALSYNVFVGSNNRPNYHLENYNLSVAYNEVIYKRILDYQITPNLDFQRANSFRSVAGVNLSITLNF